MWCSSGWHDVPCPHQDALTVPRQPWEAGMSHNLKDHLSKTWTPQNDKDSWDHESTWNHRGEGHQQIAKRKVAFYKDILEGLNFGAKVLFVLPNSRNMGLRRHGQNHKVAYSFSVNMLYIVTHQYYIQKYFTNHITNNIYFKNNNSWLLMTIYS